VIQSQHDLAMTARLAADAELPLPVDHPHVAEYHTRFDQLFARRLPPLAARRVDRTLPLAFRAIDRQALAVAAAEEADADADRAYEDSPDDENLARRIRAASELLHARRTWIDLVCRYNESIAQYVVAVAKPSRTGSELVRMLIKPTQDSAGPMTDSDHSPVAPAGHVESPGEGTPHSTPPSDRPRWLSQPPAGVRPGQPIPLRPTPAIRPLGSRGSGQPTPAVRPGGPAAAGQPTPAVRPSETISPNWPTPAVRPIQSPPSGQPTPAVRPSQSPPSGQPTPAVRPAQSGDADRSAGSPVQQPIPAIPADDWRPSAPRMSSPFSPRPEVEQGRDQSSPTIDGDPAASADESVPEQPAAGERDARAADPSPTEDSGAGPAALAPEDTEPRLLPMRPMVPIEESMPAAQRLRPSDEDRPLPRREPAAGQRGDNRRVAKPVLYPGAASTKPACGGSALYPALATADPAKRAKQLTTTLHWHRCLPDDAGPSITLRECLQACPREERLDTIEAYWSAASRAAEYQVWRQNLEWLEMLTFALTAAEEDGADSASTSMPDSSTTAVRERAARHSLLEAAKASASAAVDQAHANLVAAQFELAQHIGRHADANLPVPATTPHSGRYALRAEVLPPGLARTWPLRRLLATIPRWSDQARRRTTAVIASDQLRAELEAETFAGRVAGRATIDAIHQQTRETLALLDVLEQYNRAISRYVLAVLPSSASADDLAASMVIEG